MIIRSDGPPLRSTDWPVASDRLLALFAAKDLEALIDMAFPILQATVACDFASAFYRSAGKDLMKERDSRGRAYGPAFMRRLAELSPALPLAMANRGIKVVPTRTGLPFADAELRKTEFYREIMQPRGWRHAVALCFWGDPPAESPIFVTSVHRSEGRTDFSEEDLSRLEHIHPFLDCAVTRVHEREAAKTVREGMAMAVRDGARGMAILDRTLLLVQANPMARRLCAAWLDDADSVAGERLSLGWRLPPDLLDECRGLQQEWQALVHAEPDTTGFHLRRMVSHPHVPGLTASITMICPSTASLAEPTFLLELDRGVYGAASDTPMLSVPVLQKMTATERAVAMVLADGLSNQEIADRLGKSVNAVKFLLHRIYQKTGVPSRAALVAVLRSRQT